MARSAFGHIQRLDNGKYRCFWRCNGKRCSKVCSSFEEATELLAKERLKSGHVNYGITYREYYNAVILPQYEGLSVRTRYDNAQMWEELDALIGKEKIANTNWRFVQNIIDRFDAHSKQKRAMKMISRILNNAVKDEIIPANPCSAGMNFVKPKKIKKDLYTREQLVDVLNTVDNTEFAIPLLLECCCGLRHEEFCGLTLSDFSKDKDGWVYINIDRALTEVAGKRVMKETKNANSERVIVLHYKLAEYFEKNIAFMTEKQFLDDFKSPGVYRHHWTKYCKKNGVKYVPFGHMRSVYATLSGEAGCLDSLVEKSMGHTGRNIKDKHYQTSTIKALKINAEMFAEYILSAGTDLGDVHTMYTRKFENRNFKAFRNDTLPGLLNGSSDEIRTRDLRLERAAS